MEQLELVLANREDVKIIHELQFKAFLPLYKKYHNDETSPIKETIEKTEERIVEESSEFYKNKKEGKEVEGVRVKRKKHKNENYQEEFVQNMKKL